MVSCGEAGLIFDLNWLCGGQRRLAERRDTKRGV